MHSIMDVKDKLAEALDLLEQYKRPQRFVQETREFVAEVEREERQRNNPYRNGFVYPCGGGID